MQLINILFAHFAVQNLGKDASLFFYCISYSAHGLI